MPRLPNKRHRSPSCGSSNGASPPSRPVYSAKVSPMLLPQRTSRHGSPMLTPSIPPTASVPTIAALATSAFTQPELMFHVEAYRKSNNVLPRDIANLMLWGIPTTVPLVESPKWLCITNRSHVRGVLTVYASGISYDVLMRTGCGVAASIREDGTEVAWNETICERILYPIRRGCCYAHNNSVQHSPIWVPSQNNRLELDIFLRTEGNRRTNSAHEKCGSGRQKSMLDVAKQVAMSGTGSAAEASTIEVCTTATGATQPDLPTASLFSDQALMDGLALSLTKHISELSELQFIVEKPTDDQQWSTFPRAPAHKADGVRVVAFDCEMVLISNNVSALARCTLLDVLTEEVLLDILVKPDEEIIDYVTRYSGITEEMLASVTTTLRDAQKALCQFIDEDTYVIGHSLENDFKACKMLPNCRIVDTAHLFPHPAGPPYKNALRYLAQHFLKRQIQTGEHDSREDALTCAHLVLLKLQHGPEFGMSSRVNVLSLVPQHALNDPSASASQIATSNPVHIELFDESATLRSIASTRCNLNHTRSDDDTSKKVGKYLRRMGLAPVGLPSTPLFLAWAHLHDCEVNVVAEDEAAELVKIDAINERVMSMIRAAPDDTLINIVAANCRQGNGNKLSKAHGILFSFIKSSRGSGPPAVSATGGGNGCQQS